jgi:hypothetical protein
MAEASITRYRRVTAQALGNLQHVTLSRDQTAKGRFLRISFSGPELYDPKTMSFLYLGNKSSRC